MDQKTAKLLFEEGATLFFLDVPIGTEFGIDYNSWRVGPKFKGVKMIPPGIHFIYYSAQNSDNQTAPRTGFFYNFSQKEVVVKKWDPYTEDIKPEIVTDEEVERLTSNKKELDKNLGPYPYDSYKRWVSLTSQINAVLLDKLQPTSKQICSVPQFESKSSNTASRKLEREQMDSSSSDEKGPCLPTLNMLPEHVIHFTDLKIRIPEGASPSDISKYNIDHTYTLDYLLENEYPNPNDILGETQFAFVCFVIGQVYDAFEQWKKFVHMLCSCESALEKHSDLFSNFIHMLHFQLKEIPEDFFVDIVSSSNFLTGTLQEFFSSLEESDFSINADLRRKGLQFREHLTMKFKWDFKSEPDDYSPAIVDLQ